MKKHIFGFAFYVFYAKICPFSDSLFNKLENPRKRGKNKWKGHFFQEILKFEKARCLCFCTLCVAILWFFWILKILFYLVKSPLPLLYFFHNLSHFFFYGSSLFDIFLKLFLILSENSLNLPYSCKIMFSQIDLLFCLADALTI